MAQPPPSIQFQTNNYPAQHKALLDLLLPQLQGQFDPIRALFAGGITRANSAGQDLVMNIATPATDWITCSLVPSFTSTVAQTQGFNAPRYRYAQGALYFDGACEWNGGSGTPTGTTAIPVNVVQNLPILQSSASGQNADIPGGWIEINAAGGFTVTYAATALLRYIATTGIISLRGAGTAALASPWGIVFLGLTCQFPTPGLLVPPLSCFPQVLQTTVPNPTRVTISKIIDVTSPQPANYAVSAGSLYWTNDTPGTITVRNIAGLALGRNYQVVLSIEP